MRRVTGILMVIVLLCSGCGTVKEEQEAYKMVSQSGEDTSKEQDTQTETAGETNLPEDTGISDTQQEKTYAADGVDYDLTDMDGDMVYAMVYQMMIDPDTYTGKTFRIRGQYSVVYDKHTKQYYHYCIIKDALACCAQGLEFVWGDGSHVYPDEYPKEEQEIEVKGTFETYREPDDENLYCRLADATMQMEK